MKYIITFAILVGLFACGGGSTTKKLNLSIKTEGGQIVIDNQSNQTFRKGNIIINDKYKKRAVLQPNQAMRIDYSEFTDNDGNRFSLMQKPKSIEVIMLNDEGRWVYEAKWN